MNWWLASVWTTASTSIDPSGVFLQYGAVGGIAILGIVFIRAAYKREMERADHLEAEVQRLNQVILDKYVPALEAASSALQESTLVLTLYQRNQQQQYPQPPVPRRRTKP